MLSQHNFEHSCYLQTRLHKTYKKIVENISNGEFEGKLLDVGCGDNAFVKACNDNGLEAIGIDYDQVNLETDNLPFQDGSFDYVTANAVIEHLFKPHKMMEEVNRILKNEGLFMLTTPNWDRCYKNFYRDPLHVHPYNPESISMLMNMFDFKIVFLEPKLILKSNLWWKIPFKWHLPIGTKSMFCIAKKL